MAFNPELGSTSPAVLLDNAERLDKLVNGSELTEPDRAGDDLDTWRGMMAKNEALTEETRQNLIPLSRQYATLEAAQADIVNIPEGSTTYYRSPDDSALAIEVINNAGTLQPTGRKMPSRSSVLIGVVDSWINSTIYPFDTLISKNENSVSMNVAAVSTIAYREAYSALLSPVAVGDIITVRYKYSGTGGAPTIGLKTSLNGTFVSNQPTLTSSNDWQEVQLTATAATATLLAIGVNTRLATTVQLWKVRTSS